MMNIEDIVTFGREIAREHQRNQTNEQVTQLDYIERTATLADITAGTSLQLLLDGPGEEWVKVLVVHDDGPSLFAAVIRTNCEPRLIRFFKWFEPRIRVPLPCDQDA